MGTALGRSREQGAKLFELRCLLDYFDLDEPAGPADRRCQYTARGQCHWCRNNRVLDAETIGQPRGDHVRLVAIAEKGGAAAVPYLHLLALVMFGHMWGQIALAAQAGFEALQNSIAAIEAAIDTAPYQKEPVTKMRPAAARKRSLPVTAPSA